MRREMETLQALAESEGQEPRVETVAISTDELVARATGLLNMTDAVVASLRTVHDPEIPVNVYDLGLIYRIELDDPSAVEIDMTLTAPGCPVAGEMLNWVRNAVCEVDGIGNVQVNLVFDPPWDTSRMSEEAKLELGLL